MAKTVPKHYQNVARKCIYCGVPGVTKTHIWPDWLKHVMARYPVHWQTITAPEEEGGGRKITKKPGDPFSTQPRLACEICNGGWMKTFEDKCRIFLPPLILTKSKSYLSHQKLTVFVGWLSLIIINAEYTDEKTRCISKRDRLFLKRKLLPPDNWSIYVGFAEGPIWLKRYRHRAMYLRPLGTVGPKIGNLQITTMGIGNILVHAIVTPSWKINMDFERFCEEAGLIRIWPLPTKFWPIKRGGIIWPPDRRFNDVEALRLSNAYRNRLNREFGLENIFHQQ